MFNSVSGEFCCLLRTFNINLDPDQARQNDRLALGPSCQADVISESKVLEKVMLKIICRRKKIMKNYPASVI